MGLNENKGQRILLRLRTDDLKGFRKMLSIRKVLFHELTHNVHSEHNGEFFNLMRQVEKECNEMDWTQGSGQSTGSAAPIHRPIDSGKSDFVGDIYEGGKFRLGGRSGNESRALSARELAARAALSRLNAEEAEIQRACGCASEKCNQKFPAPNEPSANNFGSNRKSKE